MKSRISFLLTLTLLFSFILFSCEMEPVDPDPGPESEALTLADFVGTYQGTLVYSDSQILGAAYTTPTGAMEDMRTTYTAEFETQLEITDAGNATFMLSVAAGWAQDSVTVEVDSLGSGDGVSVTTYVWEAIIEESFSWQGNDTVYTTYLDESEVGYWDDTREVNLTLKPASNQLELRIRDDYAIKGHLDETLKQWSFSGEKVD